MTYWKTDSLPGLDDWITDPKRGNPMEFLDDERDDEDKEESEDEDDG